MTYAYLKKYSARTNKNGFYIDGPNWTLQTTHRADKFFRQSTRYHDDTQLPLTIVKTLIHLGEVETGGRRSKDEMLDWFPPLNPEFCDMNDRQIAELREFVVDALEPTKRGRNEVEKFNDFLQKQTPIDPTVLK